MSGLITPEQKSTLVDQTPMAAVDQPPSAI
jgi:hypothetical protein